MYIAMQSRLGLFIGTWERGDAAERTPTLCVARIKLCFLSTPRQNVV